MKAAKLSKLGVSASLLILFFGTVGSVNASFFKPAAAPAEQQVEITPELQTADKRVEDTGAKLEQARKQLSAARASLKAADAEFRAAKADKEALLLRQQADNLADVAQQKSATPSENQASQPAGTNRLVPYDASSGAPVPAATAEPSVAPAIVQVEDKVD